MASEINYTYELPSQGQNGLDCELKTGANKEVFERWTESINCHYIEARFCAKIKRKRDPGPSVELLVDRELMF